jgi:hypothetical protein
MSVVAPVGRGCGARIPRHDGRDPSARPEEPGRGLAAALDVGSVSTAARSVQDYL